ncbi:MAG TPA: catalase [Clostridiaceae bacterium]|nr:catalase [Clostridiaceae bacterium]
MDNKKDKEMRKDPIKSPVAGKAMEKMSEEEKKMAGDKPPKSPEPVEKSAKDEQLEMFTVDDKEGSLTTNQGVKMAEDEFSLKAGERGPTLMEDFHFREKITHFDHERIPERIVHARGTGVLGVFELTESMKEFTKAHFMQEVGTKTPMFVRFSTVVGFRGSADTIRDVRGVALKFYTQEGNYDIVGNNMPVFFIQDAIKFPDLVHAIKPEPHNEVPQASAAHDTFWDFVANNQESAHTVIWAMSDRALPRSYRMMEGFGVHTFRFINAEGKSTFVKFHMKPKLGIHSLVWDETQKIAGKDPDFNRKDLQEAIQNGDFAEYDFGVQMIPEGQEDMVDFDILDATKIWPEEDVPVKIFGKITLNRNVDNFFAEVEQAAFHPGHVVPGIDFTNDPLLQGRLFSYTDTQLIRLGGPNFHEIPINRPIVPYTNNQRDGYHRMTINQGRVAYHNNSIADNKPDVTPPDQGGFEPYMEKIEGKKIRARSDSFKDHFSQTAMFYNSMTDVEKKHIIEAFSFELGKVESKDIRQQVVEMFGHVNIDMMTEVAKNIGAEPPKGEQVKYDKVSPALSQMNTIMKPDTLKIGILITEGFNGKALEGMMKAMKDAKVQTVVISSKLSPVADESGGKTEPKATFTTMDPVVLDGIYVNIGKDATDMEKKETAKYIQETYMHFTPLAVTSAGAELLKPAMKGQPGVLLEEGKGMTPDTFIEAIAKHRHWDRNINIT